MVLIISRDGSASLSPQSVTAGSTAASIVVVSPFAKTTTCALYFALPSGERSAPHVLTPSSSQTFADGVAYEFRLTADVVANRGTVEVIAEFTSADGAVFRSIPASFNVLGTVGITVPEYAETDPWAEVMEALSALSGTIGSIGAVVQTTGESTTDVMSQKAVTDLFADLTYVAPSVSSFSLVPATLTYKLPATYQLTKIKHAEKNAGSIAGNLTLKRGTTVIKDDIQPSTVSAEVSVSAEPLSLSSPIVYTLSGVDKKGNAFSRSITVSGYHTAYIGASAELSITANTVGSLTDVSSSSLSGTKSVTFTGDVAKYIWFCSTSRTVSVTSSGFTVPVVSGGTFALNGATYYCYRTADKVLAGTHTFDIA